MNHITKLIGHTEAGLTKEIFRFVVTTYPGLFIRALYRLVRARFIVPTESSFNKIYLASDKTIMYLYDNGFVMSDGTKSDMVGICTRKSYTGIRLKFWQAVVLEALQDLETISMVEDAVRNTKPDPTKQVPVIKKSVIKLNRDIEDIQDIFILGTKARLELRSAWLIATTPTAILRAIHTLYVAHKLCPKDKDRLLVAFNNTVGYLAENRFYTDHYIQDLDIDSSFDIVELGYGEAIFRLAAENKLARLNSRLDNIGWQYHVDGIAEDDIQAQKAFEAKMDKYFETADHFSHLT